MLRPEKAPRARAGGGGGGTYPVPFPYLVLHLLPRQPLRPLYYKLPARGAAGRWILAGALHCTVAHR